MMQQLTELVNSNPGMAIIAVGFASIFLYKFVEIFKTVFKTILSPFYYGIHVDEKDQFLIHLYPWLAQQRYLRVKTFKIEIPWSSNISSLSEDGIEFSPIDGTYYCKPKGLPLFSVHSWIEVNGNTLHKRADIKVFTLSRKRLRKLVDAVISHAKTRVSGKIFRPDGGSYWDEAADLDVEFFQSQFVTDAARQVFDEVDVFLRSRELYLRKNLKYRKGFLLPGIPGSGKSTLAGQVAAKFGMNVYIMSGAAIFNAGELLGKVPHKSVILFEDFDLASLAKRNLPEKEEEGESRPTLPNEVSGYLATSATAELLNALDGLISMKGSILIATTNNIEALDAALIRPGRFDTTVEMDELSISEQEQYIAKFYDRDNVSLPANTRPLSIAAIASMCTDNMLDYQGLMKDIEQKGCEL